MFHFLQRLGFLAVPFPLPSLKLCVVLPAIKLSASGEAKDKVMDMITRQIVNGESNDTIQILHLSMHHFGALLSLYITVSLSPFPMPSRSNCYHQSLLILPSELTMSLYVA